MSGKNADLNTADNDIQPSQLAADHGNTGTATSESGKASVLNRRTLGVASVLGLLFASLLAGTLFFTSADDSASPAPKVDAKTVSGNTVSAHAQIKPAEFSTANSFNHSVLDPANVSASPKAGRALAASRNQGAAETSAAQSTSANSAHSQCSDAACLSPRRAPVATTGKFKLFKLGVADSALVRKCMTPRTWCSAGDGELVAGARFALYKGSRVDDANKVGEYTVGEGGVELSGLQQGSYTLKEVAAPAGYELNPDTTVFKVFADGKVGGLNGKRYKYFDNNEFYFPNLKAPVPEVWLFKLGVKDLKDCTWGSCSVDVAGSELLGGAEFALYEGTAADEAHKVGETFTVGQDGLKIPGLQVGKTYTLKEVAAPENYDINPATYTFEVDADGKAKYQSDAGSEFFVDNKIYFPNQKAAPPAVTVRLFKLGVADSKTVNLCTRSRLCSASDGVLVGGARFALYEGKTVDETKLIDTYTVGEGGFELPGLQAGKDYTLKEVAAPAGYILNPNSYTLMVGADGRVGYRTGKIIRYPNGEFYIPNLKAPEPEVWLFKLGVKDLKDCTWGSCSADVAGSEILGGATFALYEGTAADEAHKVGETFTVGQDGLKIPGLQVGKTYTLKEVAAPENYDINPATYTFEVDADGKAKYQSDAGSEFFVDNKIYFPNQKAAPPAVTVRLFKLGVADSKTVNLCTRSRLCSASDGVLVGGARFALYEGKTVDETKLIDTYTVGEGGFELPGLQAGKDYTLKEVAAPAGYILNPNSYTLMVGADGRVGYRTGKIIRYPKGEFYIPNLKVQTIDISLNKVSDKDTPLENVKFDLYEADNPDKPVQNVTTGKDGKANLTVMPGGKYRLVETATAPGYALLPQAIEFQVEANGTVTIDKQNGNVNTVTGGDKTLKVVNYPEGKLPLSGQSGFLVVLLSGLSLLLVGVAISLVGRKRN
ncbi:MAG: collagen binding domain-containing protein [Varibaculum cambriense]